MNSLLNYIIPFQDLDLNLKIFPFPLEVDFVLKSLSTRHKDRLNTLAACSLTRLTPQS